MPDKGIGFALPRLRTSTFPAIRRISRCFETVFRDAELYCHPGDGHALRPEPEGTGDAGREIVLLLHGTCIITGDRLWDARGICSIEHTSGISFPGRRCHEADVAPGCGAGYRRVRPSSPEELPHLTGSS